MPQQRSSIDTPEYRRQRDAWYARLKKEGFADVEIMDPRTGAPGNYLMGVSAGDLRRNSHRIQTVRETRAFYEACRELVHDEDFWERRTDQKIWAMYAEGEKREKMYATFRSYNFPSLRKYVTPSHIDRVVKRGREEVFRRARHGEDTEGLE